MPDEVNARDKGGSFTPHDEGQFAAVCADLVNLGQRIEQYPGQPARIVDKAAIVFVTDTTGETKDIAVELTVSMNEKATLRHLLESWRGRSFTDDQVRAGVPLHKLVGVGALISVKHKRSVKGRTYGKITSISPLPKAMPAPSASGYTRPEFWADRKRAYAEEAAQWAATLAKTSGGDYPDQSPEDDGDDDLAF